MELVSVLVNAAALFLLWLFVAAGSHKLQSNNSEYYEVIFAGYGIQSAFLAQQLPKLVGVIEVVVGMLLLVPALRPWGAAAAAVILAAYALLILLQLLQGKSGMDCGCAGPDGEIKISPALLLRNLVLLSLAVFCWQAVVTVGVMPWLISVLAATVLILVYLSGEQLMVTAQRIQLIQRG
ncbi:DoxX family membrane protein [Dasania sp. GY-MA-18]|uniref:Methylamine utilization protein MauE n=1 Tax=Dasania phycosphaerae TaxID=2950436 RepID=A0A9J6RMD1_9GAMM|nr:MULTISPECIES: MauE/DoxX family redox-associated membrane protein [Dasania]MCR8923098.1 DoxX family membrane protein [Dasania sp. GY-MA-18]MCZ0865530.1 DoxX family membrane protein [Dasania phycosphaerae]MCZ0869255.1 DoxX family membrane protein [Dasania phycosphaerae]